MIMEIKFLFALTLYFLFKNGYMLTLFVELSFFKRHVKER